MRCGIYDLMAIADIACCARIEIRSRRAVDLMDRFCLAEFAAETNDQLVRSQLCLDPKSLFRSKSQVDIIPKNGRIPALFGERSGDHLRMCMTLDDLMAGLQRRVIQRIRKLAESAA